MPTLYSDPETIPTYVLDGVPAARTALEDYRRAKDDVREARVAVTAAQALRRGRTQWIGSGDDTRMVPAPGTTQAEFDEFSAKISAAERAHRLAERAQTSAAQAVRDAVTAIDVETRRRLHASAALEAHDRATEAADAFVSALVSRREAIVASGALIGPGEASGRRDRSLVARGSDFLSAVELSAAESALGAAVEALLKGFDREAAVRILTEDDAA